MDKRLAELADMLHECSCSCVIDNGIIRTCRGRGVSDLLNMANGEPHVLDGALIADKVVGKGAAALMVYGKVRAVYADTISGSALNMLKENGIEVEYKTLVDRIMNRTQTGFCPVEELCLNETDINIMFIKIKEFIEKQK